MKARRVAHDQTEPIVRNAILILIVRFVSIINTHIWAIDIELAIPKTLLLTSLLLIFCIRIYSFKKSK